MPCQSVIYFFYFRKMYLFNETQYMRHCTASRNELNTYVRQYTCTWLIDPEHVTHSVKSLTWFNWFTDNKNIISSVHRPNNTHLKSQVDHDWTMLQVAHIPLQNGEKEGLMLILLDSDQRHVNLRYFLLLYSLLLQYAK